MKLDKISFLYLVFLLNKTLISLFKITVTFGTNFILDPL
jgi:hypothetical protein